MSAPEPPKGPLWIGIKKQRHIGGSGLSWHACTAEYDDEFFVIATNDKMVETWQIHQEDLANVQDHQSKSKDKFEFSVMDSSAGDSYVFGTDTSSSREEWKKFFSFASFEETPLRDSGEEAAAFEGPHGRTQSADSEVSMPDLSSDEEEGVTSHPDSPVPQTTGFEGQEEAKGADESDDDGFDTVRELRNTPANPPPNLRALRVDTGESVGDAHEPTEVRFVVLEIESAVASPQAKEICQEVYEGLEEEGLTEADAIETGRSLLDPERAEGNSDRFYRKEATELLCKRFGIKFSEESLISTDHDSPMEVASRWLYWMMQSHSMLRICFEDPMSKLCTENPYDAASLEAQVVSEWSEERGTSVEETGRHFIRHPDRTVRELALWFSTKASEEMDGLPQLDAFIESIDSVSLPVRLASFHGPFGDAVPGGDEPFSPRPGIAALDAPYRLPALMEMDVEDAAKALVEFAVWAGGKYDGDEQLANILLEMDLGFRRKLCHFDSVLANLSKEHVCVLARSVTMEELSHIVAEVKREGKAKVFQVVGLLAFEESQHHRPHIEDDALLTGKEKVGSAAAAEAVPIDHVGSAMGAISDFFGEIAVATVKKDDHKHLSEKGAALAEKEDIVEAETRALRAEVVLFEMLANDAIRIEVLASITSMDERRAIIQGLTDDERQMLIDACLFAERSGYQAIFHGWAWQDWFDSRELQDRIDMHEEYSAANVLQQWFDATAEFVADEVPLATFLKANEVVSAEAQQDDDDAKKKKHSKYNNLSAAGMDDAVVMERLEVEKLEAERYHADLLEGYIRKIVEANAELFLLHEKWLKLKRKENALVSAVAHSQTERELGLTGDDELMITPIPEEDEHFEEDFETALQEERAGRRSVTGSQIAQRRVTRDELDGEIGSVQKEMRLIELQMAKIATQQLGSECFGNRRDLATIANRVGKSYALETEVRTHKVAYETELNGLREKVSAYEFAAMRAEKESTELAGQLEQSATSKKVMEDKIVSLESDLATIAQLDPHRWHAARNTQRMEQEMKRLKEDFEKRLAAADEENHKLKSSLAIASDELEATQARLRQSQAELDDLQATRLRESESNEMMVKELQVRQTEHRAMAEERGKEVDTLHRTLEDMRKQQSELKQQHRSSFEETSVWRRKATVTEENLNDTEEQLRILTETHERMKQMYATNATELERQLYEAKETRDSAEKKANTMQAELDQANLSVADLQAHCASSDKRVEELELETHELGSRERELRISLHSTKEILLKLTSEHHTRMEETSRALTRLEEAEASTKVRGEELEKAKHLIETLEKQVTHERSRALSAQDYTVELEKCLLSREHQISITIKRMLTLIITLNGEEGTEPAEFKDEQDIVRELQNELLELESTKENVMNSLNRNPQLQIQQSGEEDDTTVVENLRGSLFESTEEEEDVMSMQAQLKRKNEELTLQLIAARRQQGLLEDLTTRHMTNVALNVKGLRGTEVRPMQFEEDDANWKYDFGDASLMEETERVKQLIEETITRSSNKPTYPSMLPTEEEDEASAAVDAAMIEAAAPSQNIEEDIRDSVNSDGPAADEVEGEPEEVGDDGESDHDDGGEFQASDQAEDDEGRIEAAAPSQNIEEDIRDSVNSDGPAADEVEGEPEEVGDDGESDHDDGGEFQASDQAEDDEGRIEAAAPSQNIEEDIRDSVNSDGPAADEVEGEPEEVGDDGESDHEDGGEFQASDQAEDDEGPRVSDEDNADDGSAAGNEE